MLVQCYYIQGYFCLVVFLPFFTCKHFRPVFEFAQTTLWIKKDSSRHRNSPSLKICLLTTRGKEAAKIKWGMNISLYTVPCSKKSQLRCEREVCVLSLVFEKHRDYLWWNVGETLINQCSSTVQGIIPHIPLYKCRFCKISGFCEMHVALLKSQSFGTHCNNGHDSVHY